MMQLLFPELQEMNLPSAIHLPVISHDTGITAIHTDKALLDRISLIAKELQIYIHT